MNKIMKNWVVVTKRANFQTIAEKFGIDPVIARLIRNRDVMDEESIRQYLHGSLKDLPSPWLMKGMKEAVEILAQKIHTGSNIRIIGDYDVDGVTSTYILLTGLKRLGAVVDTYIPDRVADGYGLHAHLIQKAIDDRIDTILTCDNGITASEEIRMAKDNGMTVVVTDHHEIPYRDTEYGREFILPPADAIVNPKQPECTYPNKGLCGASVAFKFILALYEHMGVRITADEFTELLIFAAIATVGDVMDLQGENRILVKEGLRKIPHTRNLGLSALLKVNGLIGSDITSYHIGFVLGPCINASGRLDTAMKALALFQTQTPDEAMRLAEELKGLNDSRKALTEQGKESAIQMVETSSLKNDRVLVVFLPYCHESLAGIIAGRIREQYGKPAFVLTRSENGVKGSGRSIEAYSMYEELVKCADLLDGFGGHPMAAGLSLQEENIDKFRARLNENCSLTEKDLMPKVMIDVAMPISYVTRNLIDQISLLAPFGKGNTKPLFAQKNLRVVECRVLGKNRNVAKSKLMAEDGTTMDGIFFGEAEEFQQYAMLNQTISIVYYPEVNCYMGNESIQLVIQEYR